MLFKSEAIKQSSPMSCYAAALGTDMNNSIADAATIISTTALDTSPGSLNSSLTPSEYPCWLVSRHAQQMPKPMHAVHGAELPDSISVSLNSGVSVPSLSVKRYHPGRVGSCKSNSIFIDGLSRRKHRKQKNDSES